MQNQTTLELDGKTVILVGTAHISRESVDEVKTLIKSEIPALVCVELDSTRYNSMTQSENWEKLDIIKVIIEGRGLLLLANLVLASFQRRLGENLGVKPGEEMLGAVQTAKELYIPYIFCDRDIQTTLLKAWRRCSFWNKMKLITVLLGSAFTKEELDAREIENLKNNSEIDGMLEELSNYLPEIKETLIDERDSYLSAKIFESAKQVKGGGRIIAVAGAGHIPGIKKHLEEFNRSKNTAGIDLSELERVPKPRFLSKFSQWIVPLVIAVFVIAGLLLTDFASVRSALLLWAVLNGTFAALGSLLALAHPVTVIVSFVCAPIGTLSPLFSVGLFAAVCEAFFRRPRVRDAKTVTADIESISGVYKNRILHTLLVFVASSLGGMAGNIITLTPLAPKIEHFLFFCAKSVLRFIGGLF